MENNRGSWGSNLGFILAAVGSAVGLGNIWGFPYKMGKSGGAVFLLLYLVLVVLVGVTVMLGELALGRRSGKSAGNNVQMPHGGQQRGAGGYGSGVLFYRFAC